MIDQEIIDEIILKHIVKDPKAALAEAVNAVQRAAFLLGEAPSKTPVNDQRLVSGLLLNARIIYLYFNDEAGSVDTFAYELALRKGK